MEEMLMEESEEFNFEPVEGDKLEQYNERRVYAAEMSVNKNSVAEATKQSQETLLAQKITGKQATIKAKLAGELVDVKDIMKTSCEPSI